MPRKQWVVVKSERVEDDDLIVVSGDEAGEDEEEDDREAELTRDRARSDFNISNVRSLSAELGGRAESDMESQVSGRSHDASPQSGLRWLKIHSFVCLSPGPGGLLPVF